MKNDCWNTCSSSLGRFKWARSWNRQQAGRFVKRCQQRQQRDKRTNVRTKFGGAKLLVPVRPNRCSREPFNRLLLLPLGRLFEQGDPDRAIGRRHCARLDPASPARWTATPPARAAVGTDRNRCGSVRWSAQLVQSFARSQCGGAQLKPSRPAAARAPVGATCRWPRRRAPPVVGSEGSPVTIGRIRRAAICCRRTSMQILAAAASAGFISNIYTEHRATKKRTRQLMWNIPTKLS